MSDLAPLAQEVGVSERTLRRAVGEGTLQGQRLSPRRLKIPVGEREYIRTHWRLLAQLRETLRTEPNVRFALLFGSTARGEDGPDSDVDLLVEMRDDSLPRIADLAIKLEPLLGREVQILSLEDAEANALLMADAAREGRVIVDRERRWPDLLARRQSLERRARSEYRSHKRRALAGIERLAAQR
ncbi:MAG: nucleotidyltransferase family protein [Methanosarcina sp.]